MPPLRLGASVPSEALTTIAAQVGAGLAAIASVRLLTGLLPPAEYGTLALVTSGVGFAAGILLGPLSNAGNRFYHDMRAGQEPLTFLGTLLAGYYGVAIASILTLGIIIAASRLLGVTSPEWAVLMVLAGGILCCDAIRQPALQITMVARRRVRYAQLLNAEAWMRLVLAALIIALWKRTAVAGLVGYFSAAVVTTWFATVLLFRDERFRLGELGSFSPSTLRMFLAYGLPFVVMSLSSWILAVADRFLLALMRSPRDVGLYVAGYQAGSALLQALAVFYSTLAFPIISQEFALSGKLSKLGGYLGGFIILGLPMAAAGVLRPDIFMRLFTDERFHGASQVIPWVSVGIFLSGVEGLANVPFLMAKDTRTLLAIRVLGAVLNVSMNLVLIPILGILGSAVATCGAFLLQTVLVISVGMKRVRWIFPMKQFAAGVAGVSAATILTGVIMARLSHLTSPSAMEAILWGLSYCFFTAYIALSFFRRPKAATVE